MLTLHKSYVMNESRQPIAVQIPIHEFELLEEIIENFGLAALMDETTDDERFSAEAAKQFYLSLKNDVEN